MPESVIGLSRAMDKRLGPTLSHGDCGEARLVLASNRLPLNDGGETAGGLAYGLLDALADDRALWFGCSGGNTENDDLRISALGNLTLMATHFPAEDYARFYNGFCNSVLWPTCHGMPERVRRTPGDYQAYRRTNQEFATTMRRYLLPHDNVWVHDYHLLPLGRCLRQHGVANRTGFFFHVPVPDPVQLKHVAECLDVHAALSAYDCIGVQTAADAARLRSFPRDIQSRIIVAPVSIDIGKIQSAAQAVVNPVGHDVARGRRLLVGIDRLDYTKGLLERLEGFDILLRDYPKYREAVTFLQVLAPCRTGVAGYAELQGSVRSLVDDINSRWGTSGWQPVYLHEETLPREHVAALLRSATVGLVTPLCDGMNLVAKEFIAAQDAADPGTLVLSRQAGAAETLAGAQLVNASKPGEIASAIDRGLRFTLRQRRRDQRRLLKVLREQSAAQWAKKLDSVFDGGELEGAADSRLPVARNTDKVSRSGFHRAMR